MAFDQDDGLISREVNGGVQPAGWKGGDGRLWFPTIKGVTVVDPTSLSLDPPPPIVLEDVVVDQEKASRQRNLVLKPGTDKLSLSFRRLRLWEGVRSIINTVLMAWMKTGVSPPLTAAPLILTLLPELTPFA